MTNAFATLKPDAATVSSAEPAVSFDPKFAEEVLQATHENVSDTIFVVDFKMPTRKGKTLTNPDGETYVQVGWATDKGKYVNVYFYFDPKWVHPGATVRAAATIRKKVRSDGQTFLYAELRPTSDEPTHRMFIGGEKALESAAENAEVFRAFDPIPGGITMTPVYKA